MIVVYADLFVVVVVVVVVVFTVLERYVVLTDTLEPV